MLSFSSCACDQGSTSNTHVVGPCGVMLKLDYKARRGKGGLRGSPSPGASSLQGSAALDVVQSGHCPAIRWLWAGPSQGDEGVA